MIVISCALYSEAKPIIEHFKLKQIENRSYKIFKNEKFILIVTGIGKVEAAGAVGYIFGKFDNILSFLNVGIAGHSHLEVGSFVLAHKISDNKRSIYPLILFDFEGISKQLITQDEIEKKYESDSLYDLEAYSALKTASKFLPFELVHSVKIISDNKDVDSSTVSEKEVSSLISKNLLEIEKILKKLQEISDEYLSLTSKVGFSPIFDKWHFSQTEKYKLGEILTKIHALNPKAEILDEHFKKCEKGQDVLDLLKEKLKKSTLIF